MATLLEFVRIKPKFMTAFELRRRDSLLLVGLSQATEKLAGMVEASWPYGEMHSRNEQSAQPGTRITWDLSTHGSLILSTGIPEAWKTLGLNQRSKPLSSTLGPPHGHQQQFYVNKLISEWETRFPKQKKKEWKITSLQLIPQPGSCTIHMEIILASIYWLGKLY